MARTLAEIDGDAERLAFVAGAVQRSSRASVTVARRAPRPCTASVTASAAPVSAPVARPKAPRQAKALTIADLTDRDTDLLALCCHEAGHAVAGVLYGGEIRSAVVADGRVTGLQGLTSFADLNFARHGTVAFSGPWAEARWRCGQRPLSSDVSAALERGRRVCGSDHGVLLAAGGVSSVSHTVPSLLERCWPAVVTLARKLLRDGEARA